MWDLTVWSTTPVANLQQGRIRINVTSLLLVEALCQGPVRITATAVTDVDTPVNSRLGRKKKIPNFVIVVLLSSRFQSKHTKAESMQNCEEQSRFQSTSILGYSHEIRTNKNRNETLIGSKQLSNNYQLLVTYFPQISKTNFLTSSPEPVGTINQKEKQIPACSFGWCLCLQQYLYCSCTAPQILISQIFFISQIFP